MILDNAGIPIFFRKMPFMATDFKLQPNGFLTYFHHSGHKYYALDNTYSVVDSFQMGNGYQTDIH